MDDEDDICALIVIDRDRSLMCTKPKGHRSQQCYDKDEDMYFIADRTNEYNRNWGK